MAQEKLEGFKILQIRKVPPGAVLNASTAENYPLIDCGSWVSDDGMWMIQRSFSGNELELIPLMTESWTYLFGRTFQVVGTFENIQNFINEFNASRI